MELNLTTPSLLFPTISLRELFISVGALDLLLTDMEGRDKTK